MMQQVQFTAFNALFRSDILFYFLTPMQRRTVGANFDVHGPPYNKCFISPILT